MHLPGPGSLIWRLPVQPTLGEGCSYYRARSLQACTSTDTSWQMMWRTDSRGENLVSVCVVVGGARGLTVARENLVLNMAVVGGLGMQEAEMDLREWRKARMDFPSYLPSGAPLLGGFAPLSRCQSQR